MFVPLCYNTRCSLCNAQLEEDLWATHGPEQYCDTCAASLTHTPSQDTLLYGRPLDPFEEEIT